MSVNKKMILLLLMAAFVTDASSQLRKPLEKRKHSVNKTLYGIIEHPWFETASFAFYAADLNSGEVISSYNADLSLRPASNLKLLSTATALEILGPEYSFETKLAYSGDIDSLGTLIGDLYIIGGRDPSLGSEYFDSLHQREFLSDWVNACEKLGIDSIAGAVIADEGDCCMEIIPPTWVWEDLAYDYGAAPSGLCIYDNTFDLYLSAGSQGDTAEILAYYPKLPGLRFLNRVIADTGSKSGVSRLGHQGSGLRLLTGSLPANTVSYKRSVVMPHPPLAAAVQLDSALRASGTAVRNKPGSIRKGPPTRQFYSTFSPELREIIRECNIHSINLFAEHSMLEAAIKLGSVAETGTAADTVRSYWEANGMNINGMRLEDGSGLSGYNSINTKQMVFVLSYMRNSPYFDHYYSSLPIAGRTGTLKNMFKDSKAEGSLRAKSGTLSWVKAYSGYVTSASGREIAFSMIVNNMNCSTSEAARQLERLMISLSEFDK